MGTLCSQLLPQFYIDSFETLQMLYSWSEDQNNPQIFPLGFVKFWTSVRGVPCVGNCSYSLIPHFLKLYRIDSLSSLSEDVHVVRYNPHDYFCH